MERLEFIMVRVQLPESKIETPSTLTPICWLPVPTYLTTTKEWWSITMVGEGDKPHAPQVLSHAGGHGHHQVHPVLPNGGVGRQVHQCLVRREKHRLTCAHGIQLKSVHVKDNFKTAPLLKMIFFKSKIKVFESLHQPKLEGQLQLWAREVDRRRPQTLHRPTLNPFHSPGFWVCVKVKIILRASVGKKPESPVATVKGWDALQPHTKLLKSTAETPVCRAITIWHMNKKQETLKNLWVFRFTSHHPFKRNTCMYQLLWWYKHKKMLIREMIRPGMIPHPPVVMTKPRAHREDKILPGKKFSRQLLSNFVSTSFNTCSSTRNCAPHLGWETWERYQGWKILRFARWKDRARIPPGRKGSPGFHSPGFNRFGLVVNIFVWSFSPQLQLEGQCRLWGHSRPWPQTAGNVKIQTPKKTQPQTLQQQRFKFYIVEVSWPEQWCHLQLQLSHCSSWWQSSCRCQRERPLPPTNPFAGCRFHCTWIWDFKVFSGRVDCGQVWSSWLHPVVWFALYNILCNEYQTQC